jgi:two-component system response regulator AgrA
MLPIYICEDMEEELQYFKYIINKTIEEEHLDGRVVCAAKKPADLLDHLADNKQQSLYFLDVDLKADMNGVELGREIRKYDPRGFIVMVTTYESLTPLIFKLRVEAMDYIIKNKDDVKGRIHECLRDAFELYMRSDMGRTKERVRIGNSEMSYDKEAIYYFEADGTKSHGILLYTVSNVDYITSSLSEIQSGLDDTFFRCHKSFIVNLSHIKYIDKDARAAVMDNGKNCPISKRILNTTEEKYNSFLESRRV